MNLPALIDDLAIRRTLAEYCHLCDAGDFDALLDLFPADAELVYGPRVERGRAGLRTFFEDLQGRPDQKGRHLTTDTVIDLTGDRATAISGFVFLRFKDGQLVPAFTGTYRDKLIRCGDRWRIERREIIPLSAAD